MSHYIVIAAASGTGEAIARHLIAAGHTVTGTWHIQPPSFEHPSMNWHALDATAADTDWSFLPEVADGLVYCPGAIPLKPFTRAKAEDFRADYEVQVVGAVRAIQAALPSLKKAPSASIVLFSTVAVGQGFTFHSVVSASKGAIEGLTRALAAEMAPSIRVNAIAPSLTQSSLSASLLSTPEKIEAQSARHPMKRIGQPDDLAHAAVFLLGQGSSWMTGQVIPVDGGMSVLR